MQKLNIALAQINFTVGDLVGNQAKILDAHSRAHADGADLVVFSEMAITGYPPEDLVLRPNFQDEATDIIRDLAPHTKNGTAMLVGCLWREGKENIFNAAALLDAGEIKHITCKYDLPNYGVFDEKRVFFQPPEPEPIDFRGVNLGVMICEDLWNIDMPSYLKEQGAEILVSINASPFETDKLERRMKVAYASCEATALPLIYVNETGGQDELVFDGGSFLLDAKGNTLSRQPYWEESLLVTKWQKKGKGWVCDNKKIKDKPPEKISNIYKALKTGLCDYVEKNNFPGVIIGLSGGIDSALSAAIAADSIGRDKVHLVMMPSVYTSEQSLNDAIECAKLLDIELDNISIEKAVNAFDFTLENAFKDTIEDTTEENVQSRIRGVILMALSNKFGKMVLTTGNKSEMAVGYATLYGDMCGGFNVLKDIYKTDVFAMAKWRNEQSYVIPENIIDRPPSAELRPDQKDEDSLPSYEVLDDILQRLIEMCHSTKQVAEHGHPVEIVKKIAKLVKISEYKRRQAPPGVKISGQAFGKDRRYPITSKFNF